MARTIRGIADFCRDHLSLDFVGAFAARRAGGGNNPDARQRLTGADRDQAADSSGKTRHRKIVQRHHPARHGRDAAGRGRRDGTG